MIIQKQDFIILKPISSSNLCKISLVQYKNTQEVFTLRALKKDILISEGQIQNTLLEKKILQTLDNEFLLSLIFCFQTEDRVFFVLPYMR